MTTPIPTLALALLAGLATGCTSKPILNIENRGVQATAGQTREDLQAAILRAGVSSKWGMKVISPGLIEAQLINREHQAVVDISFSATEYSIRYKDSRDLNYKPKGTIHRNYNRWVARLSQLISREISRQASASN
jgi:hypothetical protein